MSSHKDIQNQYLNIRIANQTVVPFTEAIYNKNNTNPILYQPNLYKLSVDRFQIPVDTIPLLIAEPVTVGSNELIYEFTMSDGTSTETEKVIYIPSDPNLSSSNPRYYYIYTYSKFIQLLNNALAVCYGNLMGTFSVPPHFEFDPISQKLSLVVPQDEFDPSIITGTWTLQFNYPLLRFFAGFQVDIVTQGVQYEFSIYNRYNNVVDIIVTPPSTTAPYLSMLPDINTLTRWNSLSTVVITTNLPVNQQYVETGDQKGATNIQPILTDFIVLYPDTNSYAATTLDLTNDERSWYDLFGSSPIRNIQLQVFWTDYKGETFPLFLSKDTSITMKLLFRVREDI
jgi:hypothetical protein